MADLGWRAARATMAGSEVGRAFTARGRWRSSRAYLAERHTGAAASARAGDSPPPPAKGVMSQTVAHVVGARPNFMKAAPVIRALAARGIDQQVVHTGQHYDAAMSDVFFRDLGLPEPDINLGVGSGTHAGQTAALMVALERTFLADPPALIVVYGDINSTMAASLVAAKLRPAGRPRRGRPAQLRRHDAGGDQPPRHRPAVRPAVRDLARGHRQPDARRASRPTGSTSSATR